MAEKGNRTFVLVDLLSSKERKAFGQQLESKKRTTLSFLFNGILSTLKSSKSAGLEKELLYQITFDQPYSKDKDYLLRNELRLLAKELVGFVSIEQAKKNFKRNSLEERHLFFQSLIQRKAHNLFEREWEKFAIECEEQLAFDIALNVRKMGILQWIENNQATLENYERLLSLIDSYQQAVNQHFLHQHLFGKHRQGFAERTLQALGKPIEISGFSEIIFNPSKNSGKDAYAKHLVALTESYRFRGTEKIEMLKQAAQFTSHIESKRFDQKGALASINAGIALEHFLLREFEKSLPYHKNALEFGAKLEDGKLISFVFNYLSTLIRLQQHHQAIELISKYEPVWHKLPRMRDRFLCLKAMCHIFESEPKSAEACIPEDRKSGGIDHYYYYRFLQIIVLFQKGKTELAINEAENFEHTVRYNDKDEDYLKLTQAMKKFLALKSEQNSVSEAVYSNKAKKLEQSLNETSENAFADRALFYKWLSKNLK